MLSEKLKIIGALAPAADRFNTSPATDIINIGKTDKVTFLVYHAGGTTGKATLTVEACNNVVPSLTTAIAFKYRRKTTGASDTWGAVTDATNAGIDTVAAEDTIVEIEVDGSVVAATDRAYVRLKLTEAANDPVNAAVIALAPARYVNDGMLV